MLAPLAIATDGGLVLQWGATGIVSLAWLVVVNSGAATLLLFVLLRRGTAAAVSGLLYLVPPVTAVLAVPLLGQSLSPQMIAGLAITLLGVVLVQRATCPAPQQGLEAATGR